MVAWLSKIADHVPNLPPSQLLFVNKVTHELTQSNLKFARGGKHPPSGNTRERISSVVMADQDAMKGFDAGTSGTIPRFRPRNKMKFSSSVQLFLLAASSANAFVPKAAFGVSRGDVSVSAEIRPKTEKAKELAFGWDGTTALGGAVEVAKPTRMLEDIRAAGETIPSECEVFNANVEMNADDLKFEEVIELIDTHYEYGLVEFKNGDIVNKQGENEGSAKLLSYAALAGMDKETTLKVSHHRPESKGHVAGYNFSNTCWYFTVISCGDNITVKSSRTPMEHHTRIFETF